MRYGTETVVAPDRFLQYVRFGRGRAESTTRKYAEALALYLSYCAARQVRLGAGNDAQGRRWLLRVAQFQLEHRGVHGSTATSSPCVVRMVMQ